MGTSYYVKADGIEVELWRRNFEGIGRADHDLIAAFTIPRASDLKWELQKAIEEAQRNERIKDDEQRAVKQERLEKLKYEVEQLERDLGERFD